MVAAQGRQGYVGTQGSIGYTGNIGLQGNQGFQGSQGFQGIQGAQNLIGFAQSGNQGSQGNQGFQGIQNRGYIGNRGPQADVSSVGVQGYQGIIGSGGRQGFVGMSGYYGPQGNQGLQGSQGTQGYIGAVDGIIGYQGYQGSQGEPDLSYNTIIELFPTLPEASVALLLPLRGIQGRISGIQGVQGYQGSNVGFTGSQGYTGVYGRQGVQGAQGTQGIADFGFLMSERFEFFDDFFALSNKYDSNGITLVDSYSGLIRISSGETAGDARWWYLSPSRNSNLLYATSNTSPQFVTLLKLEHTINAECYVGLLDDINITDGIYFSFSDSANDGKYVCNVAINSVVTSVDTSILPSEYQKLEIITDGSDAIFYVDDVLVATISANISNPVRPAIIANSTLNSIVSILVDYVYIKANRSQS